MLRTRPLRWPAVLPGWSFFIFYLFVLPFCLIKKVRKTQGRTMLLRTGLYLGPPFCRAWLFL
jgi:hypothetical protein